MNSVEDFRLDAWLKQSRTRLQNSFAPNIYEAWDSGVQFSVFDKGKQRPMSFVEFVKWYAELLWCDYVRKN